ncbi:citrate/2-methylcitrate synthase [Georgenia sp. SYP-B2076]|uniref:citrate/2-methylcitrate synthase n=1 Tax=Georgenia sp. SYP-B2076 TaxID=2495881 RepID=UPI000F8D6CF3|nr:citrate/2-methylcitrate synthase [Georgenia sp. SYP-B2076]
MLTTPQPENAPDGPNLPAIFAVNPDTGAPAYRGRDVATLAGTPFDEVWGLLVDGAGTRRLPPAEPFRLPARTGDVRADVLSALAQLTPAWAYRPLLDISVEEARDNLARASVMTMSFVAQSARGEDVPAVPQREIDLADGLTERFLVRWRGEADPAAREALETFWLAMAEDGLSPSTRTARLAAQMGSDAASCLAAAVAVAGGPFGGGAVARGLALVEEAERTGDAGAVVTAHLASHGTLPGFGEQMVPTDSRVAMLRDACVRAGAPRVEVGDAVARAGEEAMTALAESAGSPAPRFPPPALPPALALAELSGAQARAGYRPNAMFWAAILLDHVGVAPRLLSALYMCGRTAGWSAHVLEVQRALQG